MNSTALLFHQSDTMNQAVKRFSYNQNIFFQIKTRPDMLSCDHSLNRLLTTRCNTHYFNHLLVRVLNFFISIRDKKYHHNQKNKEYSIRPIMVHNIRFQRCIPPAATAQGSLRLVLFFFETQLGLQKGADSVTTIGLDVELLQFIQYTTGIYDKNVTRIQIYR